MVVIPGSLWKRKERKKEKKRARGRGRACQSPLSLHKPVVCLQAESSPSGLKGDDSKPNNKLITKTKQQLQRACVWMSLLPEDFSLSANPYRPEMKGLRLLCWHFHAEAKIGYCLLLWSLEDTECQLHIANVGGWGELSYECFGAGFAKGLGWGQSWRERAPIWRVPLFHHSLTS